MCDMLWLVAIEISANREAKAYRTSLPFELSALPIVDSTLRFIGTNTANLFDYSTNGHP